MFNRRRGRGPDRSSANQRGFFQKPQEVLNKAAQPHAPIQPPAVQANIERSVYQKPSIMYRGEGYYQDINTDIFYIEPPGDRPYLGNNQGQPTVLDPDYSAMMWQEVDAYKARQKEQHMIAEVAAVAAAINDFPVDFSQCNNKAEIDGYYKQLQYQLNKALDSKEMKRAQRVLKLEVEEYIFPAILNQREKIVQTMGVLKQRLDLLESMSFDIHLQVFAQKIIQMGKKSEDNDLGLDSVQIMKTFHAAIRKAKASFLHNPNATAGAKIEFKKACDAAIDVLDPRLKEHHEWQGAINKFSFELSSLFAGGLVNNKSGLFTIIGSDKIEHSAENMLRLG